MRSLDNAVFRSACRSVLLLTLMAFPAVGETRRVTDSASLDMAMSSAGEGDEILLAPGVYPGRFFAQGLRGVTLRSEDPSNPAIIDATNRGEGLKLTSVTNVTVSDLIIRGASQQAINVDDGSQVALSTGVTLRNIEIRNGTGHGIQMAGVDGFHIDRIRLVNWGGNNVGITLVGCHFGLIERSFFQNSNFGAGSGVQAKGGSSDVIVRANRFVNANERSIQIGGATGLNLFRPLPPGDVEASSIVAEGNVVLLDDNVSGPIRAAVSFVNVRDGLFRNNIVVRPRGYVLRILKENRQPGFVDTQGAEFRDNVVIWNHGDLSQTVNRGSLTLPETFVFEGNQWFNATRPASSTPNLPSVETGGVYGVDPQVDLDGVADWDFDWGSWLVNTIESEQTVLFAEDESHFLATPGNGASFDLSRPYPLRGEWTFAPTGGELSVEAMSHLLLFDWHPADVDRNGGIEAADIDLLSQAVVQGSDDLRFDFDGDGLLTGGDRFAWVRDLVGTFFGDANLGGSVEFADFVTLADGFGSPGGWANGDFDGDGQVSFPDFVLLADSFGRTGAVPASAVPEPSAICLAALGLICAWRPLVRHIADRPK